MDTARVKVILNRWLTKLKFLDCTHRLTEKEEDALHLVFQEQKMMLANAIAAAMLVLVSILSLKHEFHGSINSA